MRVISPRIIVFVQRNPLKVIAVVLVLALWLLFSGIDSGPTKFELPESEGKDVTGLFADRREKQIENPKSENPLDKVAELAVIKMLADEANEKPASKDKDGKPTSKDEDAAKPEQETKEELKKPPADKPKSKDDGKPPLCPYLPPNLGKNEV